MAIQTYVIDAAPQLAADRLAALRARMSAVGIDGYIVDRSDPYLGEWVAPCDEHLKWLTGFTGTAGRCVVFADQACLIVDGRYGLQARRQTDESCLTVFDSISKSIAQAIREALKEEAKVGFDPRMLSGSDVEELRKTLRPNAIDIVATDDLIDEIWHDRPPRPCGIVTEIGVDVAGESRKRKVQRLAAELERNGRDHAVIAACDSVAWLLNIRGADIERAPLPHATAILNANAQVDLFIDPAKLTPNVTASLADMVTLHPDSAIGPALEACRGVVQVDPKTASEWIFERVRASSATIVEQPDPCILPKATKNDREIAGFRDAHVRDAAAMVEFLSWLSDHQDGIGLTEIDIVKKLESCRIATGRLKDIAFDTIAGSGPNGAIVHYRVTRESNRQLCDGDLLLIDSGSQYDDGTTDITRTMAVGTSSDRHRYHFTHVLKGFIAASQARWPIDTTGRDLDRITRYPLWLAGLDYNHGTGHGIGHNLCVHEGPINLAKTCNSALQAGMVLSIEPGVYREGEFGIRIENLAVVEVDQQASEEWPMFRFSPLTRVPIDRRLILASELTPRERHWLDDYHKAVHELISPLCSATAASWLEQNCAPI